MRHTHVLSFLNFTRNKIKLRKEKVGGWMYLLPKLLCRKLWMTQSACSLRSRVVLWLGEPEQRWDAPAEHSPWWWMLQGIRLLQPPKSCWFPLCLVCFDGKIKTKIKKASDLHQPTPWFSNSICKSILQTWHSFIPVSSYKHHQVQIHTKQAPIQTTYNKDYWTKQRSMNPSLSIDEEPPYNLSAWKTFTEKFHIGTKHHVKNDPRPTANNKCNKNLGRDRNLSKQFKRKKERKFDDGHEPASYRKQDWIRWVDKLACTSCFENSWNAHIPTTQVLLRYL